MALAKIRSERGHPCLVLLQIVNGLDSNPLASTHTEGKEYKALIAEIMFPWKPDLEKVLKTNPQLILSNAFSASRDKKIAGVF